MVSTRDNLHAFLDYPQVVVDHATSGPLVGNTLGVKDIYDVAGYPTGCGNPQMEAESGIKTETAESVQKLLDAGAEIIGKTQTDELTYSLNGLNAHFPQPVNPAAPDRITGGSSSGSAAAVAGGLVDIATGSDTGGSVRAPASYCGLIGLRTTHGRISLEKTTGLAPSFDTFGWFAGDPDLYRRVGDVLLGEDTATATAELLVRVPAIDNLTLPDAADEYQRLQRTVVDGLGLAPESVELPFDVDDHYWAFRYLQATESWDYHGAWVSVRDRKLGAGVKERVDFGRTVTADQVTKSNEIRRALRNWLGELLNGKILMMPTVPSAAPKRNLSFDDLQVFREHAIRLLCLSGLTGFPQITIPLGTVDSAPFGISLLGPAGSDRRLIEMAVKLMTNQR